LCKRFVQYGYFSCIKEAVPDFFNNIGNNKNTTIFLELKNIILVIIKLLHISGINSAYVGDCQNSFDEELSSIEKVYKSLILYTNFL